MHDNIGLFLSKRAHLDPSLEAFVDVASGLRLSYHELNQRANQTAHFLKSLGIEKGDRVCIYMQMVPELAIAVLACARIGAIHSVVFGAFAPDSLEARINDSECKVLITQDTGVRGEKTDIPMKAMRI